MIFLYYFVIPFLQTPDWCIKYYRDLDADTWVYNCHAVDNGTILYSDLPKLSPWITCSLDIICLGFLVFFMWFKTTWRMITKHGRMRLFLLTTIYVVCIGDLIFALLRHGFPFVTNFSRPVVVLIYLSSQRNQMKNIFVYVLKDISIVLMTIFIYIFVFAMMFFFLYEYSLQGYSWFPTPHDTMYQMIILLTTANFPDVMLPAYNASRANCLLFILFLMIGLYFLQNILLAIVFDNYKKRLQKKVE